MTVGRTSADKATQTNSSAPLDTLELRRRGKCVGTTPGRRRSKTDCSSKASSRQNSATTPEQRRSKTDSKVDDMESKTDKIINWTLYFARTAQTICGQVPCLAPYCLPDNDASDAPPPHQPIPGIVVSGAGTGLPSGNPLAGPMGSGLLSKAHRTYSEEQDFYSCESDGGDEPIEKSYGKNMETIRWERRNRWDLAIYKELEKIHLEFVARNGYAVVDQSYLWQFVFGFEEENDREKFTYVNFRKVLEERKRLQLVQAAPDNSCPKCLSRSDSNNDLGNLSTVPSTAEAIGSCPKLQDAARPQGGAGPLGVSYDTPHSSKSKLEVPCSKSRFEASHLNRLKLSSPASKMTPSTFPPKEGFKGERLAGSGPSDGAFGWRSKPALTAATPENTKFFKCYMTQEDAEIMNYPVWYVGQDTKYGYPIIFHSLDLTPIKVGGLEKVGQFVDKELCIIENMRQINLRLLQKRNRSSLNYKISVVINVTGKYDFFKNNVTLIVKFFGEFMRRYAHFNPDGAYRIVLINCSLAFRVLWKLLTPVIPAITRKKILVLGTDYGKTMRDQGFGDIEATMDTMGKPHTKVFDIARATVAVKIDERNSNTFLSQAESSPDQNGVSSPGDSPQQNEHSAGESPVSPDNGGFATP